MRYHWTLEDLNFSGLPLLDLDLQVLDGEAYEDQDCPNKANFRHPWQAWEGVDIRYRVAEKPVAGSRGKSIWYLPARTPTAAAALGIPLGTSLKIVKYPNRTDPGPELDRLRREFEIQEVLHSHGLAPRPLALHLVRNARANDVLWFDKRYHHPAGSTYFVLHGEDIRHAGFPDGIGLDPAWYLTGDLVDRLKRDCQVLGLDPDDLCLGNMAYHPDRGLQVLDVHGWTWTA